MYVFTNATDATGHNHDELKALGTPILKVEADHSCQAAWAATGSEMMGLESRVYLAEGAKVCLTVNVGSYFGLCKGTTGVVKTPVYKEGTRPPQLPEFVVVDFGDSSHGESFFPSQPD
jgi:hypothetical protein